jgi:hypothetical protein
LNIERILSVKEKVELEEMAKTISQAQEIEK